MLHPYHNNGQSTNRIQTGTLLTYSAQKVFVAKSSVYSTVTFDLNDNLIFGSNDKYIYSITNVGSLNWKYLTNGPVVSTPTVNTLSNTVYIGSLDGQLYALTSNTGSLVWAFPVGGVGIVASPAFKQMANSSVVFVTTLRGSLYSINTTGSVVYCVETKNSVFASPTIDNSGVAYFGGSDGKMYAVSYPTGSIKWTYFFDNQQSSTVAINGNFLYFTTVANNGRPSLTTLYTSNGSLSWWLELGKNLDRFSCWTAINPKDGTIYISLDGNSGSMALYAISAPGTLKWTFDPSTSNSCVQGNHALDNGIVKYSRVSVDSAGNILHLSNNLNVLADAGTHFICQWGVEYDATVNVNSSGYAAGIAYYQMSAPVVGPNRNVFFGAPNGALYQVLTSSSGSSTDNTGGFSNVLGMLHMVNLILSIS